MMEKLVTLVIDIITLGISVYLRKLKREENCDEKTIQNEQAQKSKDV